MQKENFDFFEFNMAILLALASSANEVVVALKEIGKDGTINNETICFAIATVEALCHTQDKKIQAIIKQYL